jgi:hypothetical protein
MPTPMPFSSRTLAREPRAQRVDGLGGAAALGPLLDRAGYLIDLGQHLGAERLEQRAGEHAQRLGGVVLERGQHPVERLGLRGGHAAVALLDAGHQGGNPLVGADGALAQRVRQLSAGHAELVSQQFHGRHP